MKIDIVTIGDLKQFKTDTVAELKPSAPPEISSSLKPG